MVHIFHVFFFQAEDGIRYFHVTGVQTCALPLSASFIFAHRQSAKSRLKSQPKKSEAPGPESSHSTLERCSLTEGRRGSPKRRGTRRYLRARRGVSRAVGFSCLHTRAHSARDADRSAPRRPSFPWRPSFGFAGLARVSGVKVRGPRWRRPSSTATQAGSGMFMESAQNLLPIREE